MGNKDTNIIIVFLLSREGFMFTLKKKNNQTDCGMNNVNFWFGKGDSEYVWK